MRSIIKIDKEIKNYLPGETEVIETISVTISKTTSILALHTQTKSYMINISENVEDIYNIDIIGDKLIWIKITDTGINIKTDGGITIVFFAE